MKKQFSTKWKESGQARKQRKYLANAPLHLRRKMLSSHLSKDLRQKFGRRSFPLRKNDNVKIMSGEFKGKTGKVSVIDLKNLRIAIEGVQITKKDGSKVNAWFSPSKLMITELNLDDKKRLESIKKGKETEKEKNKENKTEKEQRKEENKTENKEAKNNKQNKSGEKK
jgi:large subunit ribosomal protein L24